MPTFMYTSIAACVISAGTASHVQPEPAPPDAVARAISRGVSLSQVKEISKAASLTQPYDWDSEGDELDDLKWQGLTPIHIAARTGRTDIVSFLLESGVSAKIRCEYGSTPLMTAIDHHATECIQLLMKAPDPDYAARDGLGRTALHHAAANAPFDILRDICRNTGDIGCRDIDGSGVLAYAAWSHDAQQVITHLVANGASPRVHSFRGSGPLHSAARAGNVTAARALIESGALLEAADAADALRRPMHIVAASESPGAEGFIQLLVKAGADPDARAERGVTPLMEACRSGRIGAVRTLLAAGVDLEAVDNAEQSAVFYAVRHRQWQTAKLLVERGADVNRVSQGVSLAEFIEQQRSGEVLASDDVEAATFILRVIRETKKQP